MERSEEESIGEEPVRGREERRGEIWGGAERQGEVLRDYCREERGKKKRRKEKGREKSERSQLSVINLSEYRVIELMLEKKERFGRLKHKKN